MNQKDLRVKNIVEDRGVRNVSRIARKIGYGNPPTERGIQRVLEALKRLKMNVVEGEDGLEVEENKEDKVGVSELDKTHFVVSEKPGILSRIFNFFYALFVPVEKSRERDRKGEVSTIEGFIVDDPTDIPEDK